MKNLADFKKRLEPGVLLETWHSRLGSFGVRPIGRVQSNSFTMLTEIKGKQEESWCSFPKASEFKIVDNDTVEIYWNNNGKLELVLTYRFV